MLRSAFLITILSFIIGGFELSAQDPPPDKLFQEGVQFQNEGDYNAALFQFEKAEKAFRETGEWENAVYAIVRQARLLHSFQVDKSELALPRLQQALLLMETKASPQPELQLKLYNSLGYAYAKRLDYENSKKYLDKALKANQEPAIKLSLLSTYEGFGKIEALAGNDEGALDFFKKGAAIYPESDSVNHVVNSSILAEYATVLCTMGDYDQSLNYLQKRLNLLSPNSGNDHPEVLNTLYYIGNVYYYAEDFSNALKFYNVVQPEWEKQLDSTHAYLASLYSAMADMHWGLEDYENAMKYYDLAAPIEMAYLGEDKASLDVLMTDSASVYTEKGDYDNAMKYYNKALEYRKAKYGHRSELVGGCNNYIANAFRQKNEFRKALEIYQESMRILMADFKETDVYINPSLDLPCTSDKYLLDALHAKADLFMNIYENDGKQDKDIKASYETYLKAADLIDKIRLSPKSSGSKLFWSQKALPVYEGGINVAYELFRETGEKEYLANAFKLAEKSKSFQLRTNLTEIEAMKFSGIPEEVREAELTIKRQIADTEKKIFFEKKQPEPSNGKIKLWEDHLVNLKLDYDKFLLNLEKEFPDYFNLKFNIDVASLKVIKKILVKDDRSLILEIFEGEDHVFVFGISKNGQTLTRFERDFVYENTVDQLGKCISDLRYIQSKPREAYDQFVQHGSALFDTLVRPSLTNNQIPDRLIIIPDGSLSFIPFEILLTGLPVSEDRSYSAMPYLINKATISYGNSATLLCSNFRNKRVSKPKNRFIGFAPSYDFINEDASGQAGITSVRDSISGLSQLKFNIVETRQAAGLFKGRIFEKEAATESNFKKEAAGSAIIHLAMHALVDNHAPSYSKLIFYPETDGSEDAMLNTYELYNMELDAELVVLSACNTGKGKLVKSEGVLSLARGFLYSGCPSIVNSWWTVDDESTSELMQSFYKGLARGKTKDVALREAKLIFLESSDPATAHPYYWAGFLLNGNTEPLGSNGGMMLFWMLTAVAVLFIFGLWIRSKF